MLGCVLPTRYAVMHVTIVRTRLRGVTVRAVRMAVMPVVATIPIYVPGAAMPTMPPVRVIAPVPRRCPTNPERIPEPIVDVRTVDIYGFDDVVRAVDIFVTYHLRSDLTCALVFLYIYGCHILEYILCQHGLDNHKVFVAGRGLHYAEVIHYSVTVQIQVGESGVGVVEECFELLHVLDCAEQCSHRFQIERLAYVL